MIDLKERRGLTPRATILLLGGIAALGSLATQLLVPALPMIARELRADTADAQLVIGVFLMVMGGGQLACGPLADRFGRKSVLMGGLLLFCIGSAAAALAPSLGVMLLARAAQALGAAAGIVTARVMLGDLFPAHLASAAQATLMSIILISPVLAPVIGGQLAEWLSWRGVLACLSIAGVAGLAIAARYLPKYRPDADATPRPGLIGAYRELLGNRRFLSGTLALASCSGALYMFLGFAPFLLQRDHGLSPREIGLCLMVVALASILGTRLVKHVDIRGDALVAGSGAGLAGALSLCALTLAGVTHLAGFIGPMTLLGLGAGLAGPAGIARVIQSRPGLEGTSTSLAGAIQMAFSATAAYTLGHLAETGQLPLAVAMVPVTAMGAFAAYLARHGGPSST